MYISQVQIRNYKSFRDSAEIALRQGLTVVVGANDVGKSAFFEALTGVVQPHPHRTLATAKFPASQMLVEPRISIMFELSPTDVERYWAPHQSLTFSGTVPSPEIALANINVSLSEGTLVSGVFRESGVLISSSFGRGPLTNEQGGSYIVNNVEFPARVRFKYSSGGTVDAIGHSALAKAARAEVFMFGPQRFNVGRSPANGNAQLKPDASNLPEVLNHLSTTNPHGWNIFLAHVRRIFPHITNISSAHEGNNDAITRVWTHEVALGRSDLGVPLKESGSGIAQVLAMVYVVVTADSARTILIDEPQSFLHPGAVRKLFETFAQYPSHQYLVTTHSPSGLGSVPVETMLLLSKVDGETQVRELDTDRREDLREFLGAVGARMSDVFGTDRVLWVEGATEEACFPLIARALLPKADLGAVQILGVVNTGDLEGRHAERVFAIYDRLSATGALFPTSTGFIFDREEKPEAVRDDLTRRARGSLYWLPRRMFECYLLNSEVIAAQLTALMGSEVGSATIEAWFTGNGRNRKYFACAQIPALFSQEWHTEAHAGEMLKDLFNDLTEARFPYEKVAYC